MGVGGVRHQAERGDDGERHQRSGCALVSYNLSLIASRKSRRINVKRSKGFLFQPNGRADRASSSALRHIHCGPTAHGRQSMGGLGQQQDPPMTKLRRHCGTVYQGLASVCGSVAIRGVAAGPIRIFPVQIVELARRIGRHKSSDSRRPAKRILEQGNARSGWVRRSQGFGTLHRSGSRPCGNSRGEAMAAGAADWTSRGCESRSTKHGTFRFRDAGRIRYSDGSSYARRAARLPIRPTRMQTGSRRPVT